MTSCLLRIHSLRFFDGGLHEVPVEEVMTVALIAIFIFVPCLWLVRYLKDKRLDSDEKDKFIQIHIISTIVLTMGLPIVIPSQIAFGNPSNRENRATTSASFILF